MEQSRAFLVSFVFALLAMGLVYFWVSEQENQFKNSFGEYVSVVVSREDINEFRPIRKESLEVITVPSKFAQPGYQSSIDAFDGTVASVPIKKGEQILSTKVSIKGKASGLASQVAISYRAYSIPVSDQTGVTRLLQPGDRVDIISSLQYGTATGPIAETKTLLQNVHILAVGEQIQNEVPLALKKDPVTGKNRSINLRANNQFSTVSIEVTPVEAQALVHVLESGATLHLALRNPVDRIIVNVPTTTVDEVLGSNSKKIQREIAAVRPAVPLPPPATQPAKPEPKPGPKEAPNPFKSGGGSLVP